MRILNNYYCSYTETENNMATRKYNTLNEYGYNLDGCTKECYNESKIIKKMCNQKVRLAKK